MGYSEYGERNAVNGLSFYCTIKDYMERMSRQIIANDQSANKDNKSGRESEPGEGRGTQEEWTDIVDS